ncbi:GFA family protein [Sphingomicrobium sp. XHP0239]|uniref:GFA family protein n=1 Tax=Sphingomicrobium maritimum TaxID=3133972 RepID=UPI0031CCB971
MSVTVHGKCLCGKVRIEATLPDQTVEVCHCTMCQAYVGGPYLSTRAVEDYTIEGEENVRTFRSSDWAERGFCSHCGSALFFHYLPKDSRSFMAGLFEGLSGPIREEIFIDEKPDWLTIEGGQPRLTGAEIMAKVKAEQ